MAEKEKQPDVYEKIENLKLKAFKIRQRKKTVVWEGQNFCVAEPSYRLTEQTQAMEAGDIALFLVHQCAIDEKTGKRLFNGEDHEVLKDLPVSLVRELAGAVVSFIDPASVETIVGNSDSTQAGS